MSYLLIRKKILEELRNRNVIRQRPTSITEKIGTFGKGVNTSLANLAGSVVDLVNYMPSIAGKTLSQTTKLFPTPYGVVKPKDSPYSNIPTITELLGGTSDAIGGRKKFNFCFTKN